MKVPLEKCSIHASSSYPEQARGCVKTQFYGLKAPKAHRRACQKSIIWVECNKCRRVGHPCPTHSAFIFSRLSGYSRDAIPSY